MTLLNPDAEPEEEEYVGDPTQPLVVVDNTVAPTIPSSPCSTCG